MKRKSIDHAQLLLLKLLSGEDMYGYQIILELARRSSNVFELKEGTLYPVLHGMERERYVGPTRRLRPPAACASITTSRARGARRWQRRSRAGSATAAR